MLEKELSNNYDQRGEISEGRDDYSRTRKLPPWCNKFRKKDPEAVELLALFEGDNGQTLKLGTEKVDVTALVEAVDTRRDCHLNSVQRN